MHHDLIVFAEDWAGLPSSTQHLITQLAKTRKVVWINSIGLRRPRLTWRDVKRLWTKLIASCRTQDKQQEKGLHDNKQFIIVNPRTLPAPDSKLARWLSVKLLSFQLKPIIAQAKLQAPILWTSLPTAVDMAGQFNEHALVYYCGDDFSALAGVDHQVVSKRENELINKADLILVSSPLLAKKFPQPLTQLLTHGVDYALFSQPSERAKDLPLDGRHIAGFYGSISKWLDMELLAQTINSLPHWHFVFIGTAVVDVRILTQFSNVTLLGPRAHQALPSYSQHWTVSLLPFKDNAQIQACNPLKLSEYLATGRPIISTSFPAVAPYRGLVQIANSSQAMVEALKASEQLNQLPAFAPALKQTVAMHSWSARAEQVSRRLQTL